MFVQRTYSTLIELEPGQDILYRLPPMSNGQIFINAFHADRPSASEIHTTLRTSRTRHFDDLRIPTDGGIFVHEGDTSPARDLNLEITHSNHYTVSGTARISAESNWQDSMWRLRIKRGIDTLFLNPSERRWYRIEVIYPSQLPILERRVPLNFFKNSFEENWNKFQYVFARLNPNLLSIHFTPEIAALYGLQTIDIPLPISPLEISSESNLNVVLSVGAGPLPDIDGDLVFFSARIDFNTGIRIKTEDGSILDYLVGFDTTTPAFTITIRFYLKAYGDTLIYIPIIDFDLLFNFLDSFRHFTTIDRDIIKQPAEQHLADLQRGHANSVSIFGDFLKPWLVGGSYELLGLNYAPGSGDIPDTNRLIEPATGELIVRYIGSPVKPALTTSGEYLREETHTSVTEDLSATSTLTVKSVDGTAPLAVNVTINGITVTTPATFTLNKGQTYTMSIPRKIGSLIFDGWPDGSNTTSHDITVTVDTTLTITYLQRLFDLPLEDPDQDLNPTVGGGRLPIDPDRLRPHNIGRLSEIDHIVVLMQENRSFDQVLGYISRNNINPEVDGLLPPDHPDIEQQKNSFMGRNYLPMKADIHTTSVNTDPTDTSPRPVTAWPSFSFPDPGHEAEDVAMQIDGNMGGFVANFAKRIGNIPKNLGLVMNYFGPEDLPIYAALAREFGICDRWYTSFAGPTIPNRFVFLTGALNRDSFGAIEEGNPDIKNLPLTTPTLFDYLNESGVEWKVFEHGYSLMRLFAKYTFDITNVVEFNDPIQGFEAAARNGTLPPVTLIEPDYVQLPPGNDDHPPADMADGQILVERIVRALIGSPNWQRTLFIITYDEHGGFYDHKMPPPNDPPLGDNRQTMGPRVPTFLISPMIKRGAVFHSNFDHTTIGATIIRRFCGPNPPNVSPRLDAALDLRDVLELADSHVSRTNFGIFSELTFLTTRSTSLRSIDNRNNLLQTKHPKGDFHYLLAGTRLITGQPSKTSVP